MRRITQIPLMTSQICILSQCLFMMQVSLVRILPVTLTEFAAITYSMMNTAMTSFSWHTTFASGVRGIREGSIRSPVGVQTPAILVYSIVHISHRPISFLTYSAENWILSFRNSCILIKANIIIIYMENICANISVFFSIPLIIERGLLIFSPH